MLRKVSKGKPRGAGDVYRKFPAHQAEDAAPKLTHSYGVFIPKAIMKHSDVATAWIFVLSTGFLSKFTNSSPGLNCGNFHGHIKCVLLICIISAFPQSMPYIHCGGGNFSLPSHRLLFRNRVCVKIVTILHCHIAAYN